MASRLAAAAASSSSTAQSLPLARLISRRGLAGAAGDCGREKVNLWQDPRSPMKWKDGHFALAAVSIWGCLVYGGFKLFGGKKENKAKERL